MLFRFSSTLTSLLSVTGTHLNILRDVSPTVTHFFSLKQRHFLELINNKIDFRIDHPVREREVVEGAACLLVYDAHGCPLQEVRLGGCQDKETTPEGRLHRDHCSVAGFTLTTTPEGGAIPVLQVKAQRPTALQGCKVTQ